MSFWKVLGGAAIGVGAIAAAPFTGGGSVVGAATLLGSLTGAGAIAAGAGATGAAAGAAWGKYEKKKQTKADDDLKQSVRQEESAKYAAEVDKLKQQLAEMMKDIASREQFVVTAFALGICCANADGHICESEMEELDILVSGIGTSDKFSKTTKAQIAAMKINPPNLDTVWALIKQHGFDDAEHLNVFSTIVDMMVLADDKTTDCEKVFVKTWNSLAA
ncbi:DUF533 domain-containing protein [Vibrio renipiscarius]|uniref:DUF533 domain-containing protein n=1 Tax=Vibrio renipiscarius TaxID=1461322 RepID=UPI00069BD18D|nr:DUF533 domain-containing protein [Vibrio renipiscarius]